MHFENKSTGFKESKYVRMTLPGLPIPAVETPADLCFLCSAVRFFQFLLLFLYWAEVFLNVKQKQN